MSAGADAPPWIVARLRSICLGLPEAHEERAWVGLRWRIRQRTFAHVLTVEAGRPQAYARAAGTDGPASVLVFRSSGPELEALTGTGPPFFRPRWGPDVVGLVLDGTDAALDWDEVTELLIESYCLRAPRRLADSVNRPAPGPA